MLRVGSIVIRVDDLIHLDLYTEGNRFCVLDDGQ